MELKSAVSLTTNSTSSIVRSHVMPFVKLSAYMSPQVIGSVVVRTPLEHTRWVNGKLKLLSFSLLISAPI